MSSGAVSSDFVEESPSPSLSSVVEGDDDFRSRILRLRLPKRSATNILHKWILQGNRASASELRDISKELKRFQRYKHALEVGPGRSFRNFRFDTASILQAMEAAFSS